MQRFSGIIQVLNRWCTWFSFNSAAPVCPALAHPPPIRLSIYFYSFKTFLLCEILQFDDGFPPCAMDENAGGNGNKQRMRFFLLVRLHAQPWRICSVLWSKHMYQLWATINNGNICMIRTWGREHRSTPYFLPASFVAFFRLRSHRYVQQLNLRMSCFAIFNRTVHLPRLHWTNARVQWIK